MTNRRLHLPELGLLLFLLRDKPQAERLLGQLHTAAVAELHPGEAGSLRFHAPGSDRRLGELVARTRFLDQDGVLVFVALYLDQYGALYELDCWKADDTPLRRIPAF
jgi:hypothetical protein